MPLAGTTGLGTTSQQTGTTSDRKDHSTGEAAALGAGTGLAGGLVASDLSSRTTQPQQSSSIPPTGTSASSSQNYPLQSTTNQMDTPIAPATVPEVKANDGRDAAIAVSVLYPSQS